MKAERIAELEEIARSIRLHIVSMISQAGSGHPGGSLSAVEILTALYFQEMKLDPNNPGWQERDKFVLSKGHAAPVLYGTLAERGFFPKEDLLTLRKLGSNLQGHPDMKKIKGVEMSTGSLGLGFSAAVGMALAGKLDGLNSRVYTLLGDGEIQEGIVWEAAMAAAHYKLANLTAFLDHNGFQIDGPVTDVMSPEPVADKWQAFGWHVLTIEGHDFSQIFDALRKAGEEKNKPTIIIADTVKGKGVSFMENKVDWHGVAPKPEETAQALEELGGSK